jgi:hypothetical protein
MPISPKLRAVLDTNVLISGLIAEGGAPRQLLDAWLEDRYTLVTSLYLVEELIHVLSYPRISKHLKLTEGEMATILTTLLSKAAVTPGHLQLPGVTRDPKDDAIVACAKEGEADYIISGDQDLLILDDYDDVQIVTPRRFVEILESRQ